MDSKNWTWILKSEKNTKLKEEKVKGLNPKYTKKNTNLPFSIF